MTTIETLRRIERTTLTKLESAKLYKATLAPTTLEHAAIAGKMRAYIEVLNQVYDLLEDLGQPRPERTE